MIEHHAHDEDGHLENSEWFDYDPIDKNVFRVRDQKELTELTPEEVEKGLKVVRVMLQWIWQDGMKNVDGVKVRAIIVCWIFLKELRTLSMTDVATGYGLHKQSLGRWVDQFKRKFKNIRITHIRK